MASVDVFLGDVYRELAFGNLVHPPTVMIRRSAPGQAGFFSERVQYQSDWECFVRISRLGPFPRVARPLVAYRLSDTRTSPSRVNDGKLAVELVSVSSMIWNADPSLRADMASRIADQRRVLCLDAARESAERRKAEAARLLVAALRAGARGVEVQKIALKIVLPGWVVPWVRAARAKMPD